MSLTIHVDNVSRTFCISSAGESRLIDFATVQAIANALAGKLSRNDLLIGDDELASRQAFEKYQRLLSLAAKEGWKELFYDPRTSTTARQSLQAAKATNRQVRLFYGNTVSGLAALVHTGVVGWIGGLRVDGLPRAGLTEKLGIAAGHRVHELDIVRVVDIQACTDLYCHPLFHLPNMEVVETSSGTYQLQVDGEALFSAEHKALLTRWLRFFNGSSLDAPVGIPVFC